MSPEETFDELQKLREDVSNLRSDLSKLESAWSRDLTHLTYRIDMISNVRIWVITCCACIAGFGGILKIIETFFT